jgi:hypothetical protein
MALSAALALGACAGEEGLPTSEAPAFQTGEIGPACNLTDLRKATSALFGSKHPANETAKLFTSKNINTSGVTAHAYTLFKAIEDKREGVGNAVWLEGDPAKGAELTIQVIACSDVIYTDAALTASVDAARAALLLALDFAQTGTYAVGAGTDKAVTSKNKEAGLEAPSNFETWFGTVHNLSGRSLILGYVIPSFSDFGYEDFAEVAYDWSMIRPNGANALTGLAKISYCVDDQFNELELRVQHKAQGQGGVILPVATPISEVVCDDLASLSPIEPESFAMRLVRSVVDAVRPSPLYAAMLKGPVSGTIGGFSPTAVVDPNQLLINFADTLPQDLAVNEPVQDSQGDPMKVTVTGAQGTPWSGVDVTIVGLANNGATLMLTCATKTTNALGVVTFPNLSVNKPGGLRLVALVNPVTEGDVVPGVDPDVASYDGSATSGRFIVAPGSAIAPSCEPTQEP